MVAIPPPSRTVPATHNQSTTRHRCGTRPSGKRTMSIPTAIPNEGVHAQLPNHVTHDSNGSATCWIRITSEYSLERNPMMAGAGVRRRNQPNRKLAGWEAIKAPTSAKAIDPGIASSAPNQSPDHVRTMAAWASSTTSAIPMVQAIARRDDIRSLNRDQGELNTPQHDQHRTPKG